MVDIEITLPGGFLEEEIRDGYTVTKEIKELWAVQLDLVSKLQKICEAHNIRYFADGGTLLGTVRHRGFIPWDDDIDIGMFREDYDKFCSVCKEELEYPYFLLTEHSVDCSPRLFSRLMRLDTTFLPFNPKKKSVYLPTPYGIFVDIFPFDDINESDINWTAAYLLKQRTDMHSLRSVVNTTLNMVNKEVANTTRSCAVRLINNVHNDCVNLISNNKNADTDKVMIYALSKPDRPFTRTKSHYEQYVELDFEFIKLPVPYKYIDAIKEQYGETWNEYIEGGQLHKRNIMSTGEPYWKFVKQPKKYKKAILYGTFDLFHKGHLELLKYAKLLADVIIVGVSVEEFNNIKGKSAHDGIETRKRNIMNTRLVDIVFDETCWEQKETDILKYNADVLIMGDDWKGRFDDLNKYCKVIYKPRVKGISSTMLREQLKK